MYQTVTFLREEFLSFQTGPTFIASILSSTGSSSHIIDCMVRDIYSFSWEMQTSHNNDTEPRGLLMVINLFAMTPYDDRETTDRILSVSSIVPRFRAADKDAIRKLEKVKVQDLMSTTQCTVCLEELKDVNLEVVRMSCSHLYHEECIVKWLETNCTCPLCRYELPRSEG
ncbi:uncharacterized RING finger protein C2A9.04c-like [Pistacia vera]|uniref:uncharacterized RING finger protein C2A9.04c-like n=1 Tax=Pistacia vera TaxID=55513 RepID=UPI00126325F9|nr:uncharacterized RING finger protein C2A9.04c-like [Pistacia vera]